jgi:hypothetical protein
MNNFFSFYKAIHSSYWSQAHTIQRNFQIWHEFAMHFDETNHRQFKITILLGKKTSQAIYLFIMIETSSVATLLQFYHFFSNSSFKSQFTWRPSNFALLEGFCVQCLNQAPALDTKWLFWFPISGTYKKEALEFKVSSWTSSWWTVDNVHYTFPVTWFCKQQTIHLNLLHHNTMPIWQRETMPVLRCTPPHLKVWHCALLMNIE